MGKYKEEWFQMPTEKCFLNGDNLLLTHVGAFLVNVLRNAGRVTTQIPYTTCLGMIGIANWI